MVNFSDIVCMYKHNTHTDTRTHPFPLFWILSERSVGPEEAYIQERI